MGSFDLFKEFHREAIQQEFPPSARVLFDTLLYESLKDGWTDSLVFSERDLVLMTGLKKTTLHEAKHFLSSRHFITCKNSKKRTFFKINSLNTPTNRPPTDHFSDRSPTLPSDTTTSGISTLRVSTLGISNLSSTILMSCDDLLDHSLTYSSYSYENKLVNKLIHNMSNENNEETCVDDERRNKSNEKLNISNEQNRVMMSNEQNRVMMSNEQNRVMMSNEYPSVETISSEYPGVEKHGKPAEFFGKGENLEKLVGFWEGELRGGRLTFEHQSRLKGWIERKGESWVKEGMVRASDVNNNPFGMTPKFLFGVLETKEKSEKGEFKKNGRRKPEIDSRATWQAEDDE